MEVHELPRAVGARSGEADGGSRARHLLRHGAARPTRTWPSCGAAWSRTPRCATGVETATRGGRLRSARPGDRRGRRGLRGGGIVRGRRARSEDRQRVLVLEKGEFIDPSEFVQRERLMMPRIFDTEFSVLELFGQQIPTVSTTVVTGKLVGGVGHHQPCAGLRATAAGDPRLARATRRGASPTRISSLIWPRSGSYCASRRCPKRRSRAATSPCGAASQTLGLPHHGPDRAQRPSVHRLRLLRSGLPLQPKAHAAQRGAAARRAARRADPSELPGGRAAPRKASG